MIELIIVLLIGGIMAQLSMGKVHALMNHQRVMHAATAVQNDLEAAFQIAGRNRRPVKIDWNASTRVFTIIGRNGNIYRRTSLGTQAYGFSTITVTPNTVQVFPNGLADSDMQITFVLGNDVKKKLHMSRAGLVKAQ